MPLLSVVIPSRDRARYVGASIRTVLQSEVGQLEVLVLDNASTDGTREVVSAIHDPRLRYARSDRRLSMRDNFERGLELAQGDYLCFVGDDDGVLAHAPATAHRLFEDPEVMAIAAARAHYYWPDLAGSRRGAAILPRGEGVERRNSRHELRSLLATSDYYRLPCIYHGFVRRTLVERARRDRFFLSSQVDIYSALALSMSGVTFAYSHRPLIINGGSMRSNGASHFGGGSAEERTRWKQEDELGFLPGFDGYATVGSLVVESALRYASVFGASLADIFPQAEVDAVMAAERAARVRRGLPTEGFDRAERAAGSPVGARRRPEPRGVRLRRLARTFGSAMPIDAARRGVEDVLGAAHLLQDLLARGWVRNLAHPVEQVRTAIRIGRG